MRMSETQSRTGRSADHLQYSPPPPRFDPHLFAHLTRMPSDDWLVVYEEHAPGADLLSMGYQAAVAAVAGSCAAVVS